MMKEEIRHADNEKIDLKGWKRLVDYGLRYKARVIRTILVLLVVSGADLAYPLFTRYAINHFIMGETTEGLGLFGALYIVMVLAQGAGRVWLDKRVDPAHYEALLTAAGLDNPAARIVPPDAGGQEGSWYR